MRRKTVITVVIKVTLPLIAARRRETRPMGPTLAREVEAGVEMAEELVVDEEAADNKSVVEAVDEEVIAAVKSML